jgi:hypothetical protein
MHHREAAACAADPVGIGGHQLSLHGIHRGEASAAQDPALIAASCRFNRLPLLVGDVL